MPTPVYSIQVRGRDIGGSYRCASQEEAQTIYNTLAKAVGAAEEFFELEVQGQKVTVRKANISGFVMATHMEETPEERKARAIAQIEHGNHYNTAQGEIGYCDSPKALMGGLI